MGLLRIFRDVFKTFRKSKQPSFASKTMVLRADGGWMGSGGAPNDSAPTSKNVSSPQPPKNSLIVPSAGSTWSDIQEPVVEMLENPPEFFPQHDDLGNKLDQCLELGIITSCQHRASFKSIYFLDIELPCSDKFSEDTKRFNLFIKAMQEKYNLVVVQKERYSSKTTGGYTFKVVFEFNSKNGILNNRRRP